MIQHPKKEFPNCSSFPTSLAMPNTHSQRDGGARRAHTCVSSSLRLLYQAKPHAQTCLRSRLTTPFAHFWFAPKTGHRDTPQYDGYGYDGYSSLRLLPNYVCTL